LITALIINSKTINYQNTRFANDMRMYATDQQSKNVIDNMQTTYTCCGNNLWIDWAPIGLNATGSNSSTATTTSGGGGVTTTTISNTGATSAGTTTTIGAGGGTTTTLGTGSGGVTTTTIAGGAATTAAAGEITTTASTGVSAGAKLLKRNVENTVKNHLSSDKTSNDFNVGPSLLQQAIRRKRQSTSGLVNGLPLSSSVTLPQSCCTSSISATDNLNNLCKFEF
jgi:hypothetical protein